MATLAKANCRGSNADAVNYAKHMWPKYPEVVDYLQKANPGTGASGNWAENLNIPNFVENLAQLVDGHASPSFISITSS